MSVHTTPHDWQDSLGDWAAENAAELKHFTGAHRARPLDEVEAEERAKRRPMVQMQGRPEQGWPARRCSPEMAVYDPSDDDEAPRDAMSGAEAWMLMAAYIASVLFTVWCFSIFAAYMAGWL